MKREQWENIKLQLNIGDHIALEYSGYRSYRTGLYDWPDRGDGERYIATCIGTITHVGDTEVTLERDNFHDRKTFSYRMLITVLKEEPALRMPTEIEIDEAKLNNIPTRGFCVSWDKEKATRDGYKQMRESEEDE